MLVLGINAYHGDASAVLMQDGELLAAVEEERLRRVKHWAGFPTLAIREVLRIAGMRGAEVQHVGISRNPRANLARKAAFVLRHRPAGSTIANRLANARRIGGVGGPLAKALDVPGGELPKVHWIEHHPAHMASAFFVSGFEDAACCAIDGFGDFVSTSHGIGAGNAMRVLDRVYYPHSLGLLYTAITQYLGFTNYGDEFKVMGLAPYGRPAVVTEIRRLLRLKLRGQFELDLRYFRHASSGMTMQWAGGYPEMGQVYSRELERLLGPARPADAPLTEREEDIAHSLQIVYEEAAFHVLEALWQRTRNSRLCFAGGCAMNSVANGKIRANTAFREVYIQPGAGDNGTALGAAAYVTHAKLGRPRRFAMTHAYWGAAHDEGEAIRTLREREDSHSEYRIERTSGAEETARSTAALIAKGLVVGWYQGRMEWGARALGNRSIVADPRRADMPEIINTKIKFRERFRPFAPSVAEEAVHEYFEGAVADPFMLQVYPVRPAKRNLLPAVTHVDGSGRLQTVSSATNPLYYRLIKEFQRLTEVPVLLNTSFNENEPIVDTPLQALDCFLRTKMDALVLHDTIVRRVPQSNRRAADAETDASAARR
jgi:carbamoyltransferase